MTEQEKVLKIAKAELGTNEATNGDDKYIKWYGGLALTASWCAIWVSWVFYMLNKNKYFPKFCDCDAGMSWFIKHLMFEHSKNQGGTYIPKASDVVFFSDKATLKDSTHVGIVLYVRNGILYTIEGNSHDMVRYKSYSLGSTYILGYGKVPFKESFQTGWVKELQSLLGITPTGKVGKILLSKTPTLQKGSRGDTVRLIQRHLGIEGYPCGTSGADGSYGPATFDDVRAYQKEVVDLSNPDGVITSGNKTWKSLLNM
jgi:hypothetical protein